MVHLILLAALLAASVTPSTAFKWTAAKPTPAAEPLPSIVQRFKPPKPTQAPDAPFDLVRRAESSTDTITAYSAPDATCGYFDGRPGAPLTCGTANTCFMFTSAGDIGAIGCCPIDGTFDQCYGFNTNCINADDMASGALCDNACRHDTFTLKCTDTSAPYCAALTWPMNGVSNYQCDSARVTTTQTLYTTYRGQIDHSWYTTTYSYDSLTSGTGSEAPLPTTNDNDNDNGSTTSNKKKTPIGPIVGGVIGGVAVLAGLGLLLFFLLRRRRAAAAGPQPEGPQGPQEPQGPHTGPQGPPAYIPDANKPPLNPNTNSYYGPPTQGFAGQGQHGQEMQQQQYAQQLQQQQGYYDSSNPSGYYNPNSPQPHGGPNPTSPTVTAVSGQSNDINAGGAGGVRDSSAMGSTGAYGHTSPRPGFSEMSANMAGGPFPSDQHDGTLGEASELRTQRDSVKKRVVLLTDLWKNYLGYIIIERGPKIAGPVKPGGGIGDDARPLYDTKNELKIQDCLQHLRYLCYWFWLKCWLHGA
ncbi:hypothetical protein V496_00237 [Pseudogymnoascus sp. VKM F-4515 (FW-2607)]|nr:hypothetical protein V496_00237 [Pseudogymnoascus sp. VKM F-4515 (FW-2607)]